MRSGNTIYNLDGQAFRSQDLAKRMRDLLIEETGRGYEIAPSPGGGFVLFIEEHPIANPTTLITDRTTNLPPDIESQSHSYELRPAVVRSNLFSLIILSFSGVLVLTAEPLCAVVLDWLSVSPARLGAWWPRIIDVVTGLFILLMVSAWLGIMWQRASALFRITEFGVESRTGIFSYQTSGLRFQDISFMAVQQSAWERLLGVGGVEFRSAGSAGVPVRFYPVSSPASVLKVVQNRMAVSYCK
jgi:hypothetical protein